jgi:hypothetical protein
LSYIEASLSSTEKLLPQKTKTITTTKTGLTTKSHYFQPFAYQPKVAHYIAPKSKGI